MIGTGESHRPACMLLIVVGHADSHAVISEPARAKGHSVIAASTPTLGLSTVGMAQPDSEASLTGDVSRIFLVSSGAPRFARYASRAEDAHAALRDMIHGGCSS
jgi:hypothetical protein